MAFVCRAFTFNSREFLTYRVLSYPCAYLFYRLDTFFVKVIVYLMADFINGLSMQYVPRYNAFVKVLLALFCLIICRIQEGFSQDAGSSHIDANGLLFAALAGVVGLSMAITTWYIYWEMKNAFRMTDSDRSLANEGRQKIFIKRLAAGMWMVTLPVVAYAFWIGDYGLMLITSLQQGVHAFFVLRIDRIRYRDAATGIFFSTYGLLAGGVYLFQQIALYPLVILMVFVVNAYIVQTRRWHILNIFCAIGALSAYYFLNVFPGNDTLISVGRLEMGAIAGVLALFMIAFTIHSYNRNIRAYQHNLELQHAHLAQRQQQLLVSEKRFRSLFENAIDAILIFDIEEKAIVDFNHEAINIFGLPPAAISGGHTVHVFTELIELVQSIVKNQSKGTSATEGVSHRFERTLNRYGHTRFEAEMTLIPSNENPTELFVMIKDISARKKAEQALRSSEEKFKKLLEASPSGIVHMNRAGIQRYVSARNEELFGYEIGETLGRNILEFVDPANHELVLNGIASLFAGEQEVVRETVKAYRKDGSAIYIEGIARLLPVESGEEEGVLLICNDISDRVAAENTLFQTRATYELLYQNMFDAILRYDYGAESVLGCNEAARTLFGFSEDELLQEHSRFTLIPRYSEYTGDVDLHAYTAAHKASIFAGESIKSHGVFVRKDGSTFLADVNVIPTFQRAGEGFVIIHDVTKNVLRKKALQKSELKYRNIFEHSHQAIFIFDRELMRPIDCNELTLKMFGCETKEQFLSEPPKTFTGLRQIDGTDVDQFIQQKLDLVQEQGKAEYLSVARRLDGTEFINEVTIVAEVSEGKKQLLFFASDITEKHNAQREIVEREMIYQALIDNTFNGIDIHEIPAQELEKREREGKLIVRNETMKKIFGVDNEPLISIANLLTYTPEIHPSGERTENYIRRKIDELNRQGYTHYTWQVLNGAGELIDVDATTHKITLNDKVLLIRIAEDITDKKRQQEIIDRQIADLNRKNEELERYIESNMQLENFAYMASHDLKAPIRTLVSFSQLLEREAQEKLNPKQKEYLDFIVSASMNMHRLINDLMTYSRVNTKKHKVETVKVPKMLQGVLRELSVNLSEKQANVELRNIPDEICADPTKLWQLFQNLIVNAVKFQQPGVIPHVVISCEEETHYWRFEVSDNGIGIKGEFFQRIFLLFRRLHNAHEFDGTGIGLAICKKIAEQHGGDIWVESERGVGSTFYFTIEKQPVAKLTPPVESHS